MPGAVRSYLKACLKLAGKAEGSLAELKGTDCPEAALEEIARLIAHVRRFADQIERRVLRGEKIPHGEKVFSIFEEHTRWISKGKAGTPFELGVPVSIVEDGTGFVLGHEIMWTGGDTDVAVPLVKRCLKAVPELRGCSFDQGFHSPSNRMALDELLELNALPKKGGKSAAEREREAEPAFAAARRKHSGVESTINNLEHRGLDKVRLRGADGFELAVGLAGRRPRHPSARAEPARGEAQADAAGPREDAGRAQAPGAAAREGAAEPRAAAPMPATARRLSGASPKTGRPEGGRRRSLRQNPGKPMPMRKCRPLEPNRPRSPAKICFGRHPASRSSVKPAPFLLDTRLLKDGKPFGKISDRLHIGSVKFA